MELYTNGRLLNALTWREQDILSLLAERYTNREIAQTLGLELTTVKWYNREIYDKLGVSNRREAAARAEELVQFQTDYDGLPETDARHNLPAQITSFIGRESATRDVVRLIQTARLVTLTGPGGIGKTRLGVQAATLVVDEFTDGVWYVELAALADSRGVAPAIVVALGLQDSPDRSSAETLQEFVRKREILLLLDNFEHVLGAAPLVADLLAAAPGLKMLVSSREILRLYGEQEYPVSPLAEGDATRLFVQRAQAARPGLSLTSKDEPLVAEICARLDGLPLAIELAAARTRLMPLESVRAQLSDRFTLLTGGPRDAHARQRTLRATIDWSYDLLGAEERALLARLSVFQGGRTVEAVSDVCLDGLSLNAQEGLEALVGKGLLGWEEGPQGAPRFVMLETIHTYAREKLDERGETDALRRRHANYYAALAQRVEPYLLGGRHQLRWLARFEAEHDNLRAALAWSLEDGGDLEPGLGLVGSLLYFWFRQGHYRDWTYWSGRALELSEGAPANLRAGVLRAAGKAAWAHYDQAHWVPLLRQALQIYRQSGDKWQIALTSASISVPPCGEGQDYAEKLALCEEALALARELGDPVLTGKLLIHLGLLLLTPQRPKWPQARAAFEESLTVARACGGRLGELIAHVNLGYVTQRLGDLQQAEAHFRQGLLLARETGLKAMAATTLAEFAPLLVALGQSERAARLLSACEALNEAMGVSLQPSVQVVFDDALVTVREQLDPAAFEAAWAEGRAMSLAEAIAYALGEAGL